MEEYNPSEWYTPEQALKRLSDNSGDKKIDESYLRTLAKIGKIGRIKLAPMFSLYKKSDIDGYKVVGRGEKWSKNRKKPAQKKEDKHETNETAERSTLRTIGTQ